MRNRKYIWWALVVIGLYWTAAALTGCYTAKKAEQQVNKANDQFPAVVAKLARDKYPCTDLLKPDTAVLYRDTTVYIDCPDTVPATFETVRVDTVNNVTVRTVRVPVTLPVKTVFIDRWYEDSAKLKLAQIEQGKLQAQIDCIQADNDRLQAQSSRRGKENWIWRAIAIGLMIWQGIRLWKNMTTIKMKAI